MADLSTELGLKMRMPLVTWGRGVPGWASKDHHRREAALLTHVREVVGRYTDADAMPHVIQMDVAADVLSNVQKDPQNSPVLYGPSGWVERAFKAAREAAGNAPIRLMISDHHIESSKGGKGEAMYQYLRFLKEKGAPVNGVAMQMRVALHGTDFDSVSRQVRRIGRLGMEVHMTQLEVSCGKSVACRRLHGRNELAFQEQVEVSMLLTRICLEEPNCTTVTMAGVSVSWLDKGQRSHRSLLLSGSSYVGVRKALMGA
ncbi:unnamed protein product [Vitrella brassicaformis CCMP3155]|uniref:endo-1,4-beta-xylanase n=1 Tax=Vitrella brassicaformis (strain CCMP3155) TaxID=1169540 RepID=A0A0G4GG62_VITBC|nr:unnamed protein product [Vitrella brassicaformis CCMP3155]|eukprot:CEM28605.1 unnamed protein product [Vitrella brassicaformis CCMP3155]